MKIKKIKSNKTYYTVLPAELVMEIFSYIPENKTCLDFAMTSKINFAVFYQMMKKSSTLLYRLDFLNGNKRTDNTIDLYKPGRLHKFELDKKLYVQTLEDYEKEIKDVDIIKVCAEINKKYGPVAMIAGGYALLHLLKEKDYQYHEYFVGILRGEHLLPMIWDDKHNPSDIDIFLLGDKKQEIAYDILTKFKISKRKEGVKNKNDDFFLFIRDGICDVKTVGEEYCQREKRKIRNSHLYFQLILKEKAKYPNDIFCFFDLDICKIGYFPGLAKVVLPPDFLRAITSRKNYSDLVFKKASKKHRTRIYKYYRRTGIYTSIQAPPLLSYYHTFNNWKIKSQVMIEITKWNTNWGINLEGITRKGIIPHILDIRVVNSAFNLFGVGDIFFCDTRDGDQNFFNGKNVASYYSEAMIVDKSPFDDLKKEDIKLQNTEYYSELFGLVKSKKGNYVYEKHDTNELIQQRILGIFKFRK